MDLFVLFLLILNVILNTDLSTSFILINISAILQITGRQNPGSLGCQWCRWQAPRVLWCVSARRVDMVLVLSGN